MMEIRLVCGVDEAGRGPLAGAVFAAAVILSPAKPIRGLADSKTLSPKKREQLFDKITDRAHAWAVASASVEEIDTINILQASLLAMRRAVEALHVKPEEVMVDGPYCPTVAMRAIAVIGGDAKVAAISAASILAKVARDREMRKLHERYPVYGFDQHKGYGTALHLAALMQHGVCAIHRRSYAPVARAMARMGVQGGDRSE